MPKTDQGIDQEHYLVVPRTLIFLFDTFNRVLLLKGAENKKRWAGLFNGIGGHIEKGEDIYEAAYRELIEEAGIAGIDLHLCAQIIVDVSDLIGVAIFVFKGIYTGGDFTNSLEGVLSWVPLDEIGAIPLVEDLPELIQRVAAHQSNSPIIVGKYSYGAMGDLEISFR